MYGQPMMGQPMMGAPMMGQPMMGAPMMGAPMMGAPMMGAPMMGAPMMGPQPVYRQIALGNGIDSQEYNSIVQAATVAYTMKQYPLSTYVASGIKSRIGGEWFCFISQVTEKDYDFAMSCVKGGDFISFSLDNTLFQVCRIR